MVPHRIAIWFEGVQEFDELAFTFFLLSANTVQTSIEFCFPVHKGESSKGLTFAEASRVVDSDDSGLVGKYTVHVFVTSQLISGNSFADLNSPLVLITSAHWQRAFSPPSLFEYLLHGIMWGVTSCLIEIEDHDDETLGCLFDYAHYKAHNRIGVALGYICQAHSSQISKELKQSYMTDLRCLLSFKWLGDVDLAGTIASRLRAYFGQDMDRDTGYQKRFWQRIRPNIDGFWFNLALELIKGVILIVVTFLLVTMRLQSVHG